MKVCTKCKESLTLTSFSINRKAVDGLEPRCKECRKADAVAAYRKSPFATIARLKKSESKKKGIPFDLDKDYLKEIWTGVCPVFNVPISIGNKGQGSHHSGHLDRFDPKLGYVRGNVNFLSGRANRIKYDATIEELQQLLDWMKTQEGATTIETTE